VECLSLLVGRLTILWKSKKKQGKEKGLAMFYGTVVHFLNAIAGLKKKKELRIAQLL
jgi:hypothetical protein